MGKHFLSVEAVGAMKYVDVALGCWQVFMLDDLVLVVVSFHAL